MKKSIFKKIGGLFLGLALGLGVAVGVTAGNKASEVRAEDVTLSANFSGSASSNGGFTASGGSVNKSYYQLKTGHVVSNSAYSDVDVSKSVSVIFYGGTYGGTDANKNSVIFYATNSSGTVISSNLTLTPTNNKETGGPYSGTISFNTGASGKDVKFRFDAASAATTSIYCRFLKFTITYTKAAAGPVINNITLNQAGGTGGTALVSATNGSEMPAITLPTKPDYTFGGYYTGENGTGTQYYAANGSSTKNWDGTSDTTLYAKWTINTYKVTVDLNGGSGTAPTIADKAKGAQFNLPTAPTKTGFNFTGWSDGENTYSAGVLYTMPAKAVTFTAQWEASTEPYIDSINELSSKPTSLQCSQTLDLYTTVNAENNEQGTLSTDVAWSVNPTTAGYFSKTQTSSGETTTFTANNTLTNGVVITAKSVANNAISKSITFNIVEPTDKVLDHIEITDGRSEDTKTYWSDETSPKISGLTVTAYYKSATYTAYSRTANVTGGTTWVLSISNSTLTGTYDTKSASVSIIVNESILESITLGTTKTEYDIIGTTAPSFEKPVVTAHYSSGNPKVVTDQASFIDIATGLAPDMSKASAKTIKATFGGKESKTFEIHVKHVESTLVEKEIVVAIGLTDSITWPNYTGSEIELKNTVIFDYQGFKMESTGDAPAFRETGSTGRYEIQLNSTDKFKCSWPTDAELLEFKMYTNQYLTLKNFTNGATYSKKNETIDSPLVNEGATWTFDCSKFTSNCFEAQRDATGAIRGFSLKMRTGGELKYYDNQILQQSSDISLSTNKTNNEIVELNNIVVTASYPKTVDMDDVQLFKGNETTALTTTKSSTESANIVSYTYSAEALTATEMEAGGKTLTFKARGSRSGIENTIDVKILPTPLTGGITNEAQMASSYYEGHTNVFKLEHDYTVSAIDGSVEWTSSNPSVATINSTTGEITTVGAGKVSFTCIAKNSAGNEINRDTTDSITVIGHEVDKLEIALRNGEPSVYYQQGIDSAHNNGKLQTNYFDIFKEDTRDNNYKVATISDGKNMTLNAYLEDARGNIGATPTFTMNAGNSAAVKSISSETAIGTYRIYVTMDGITTSNYATIEVKENVATGVSWVTGKTPKTNKLYAYKDNLETMMSGISVNWDNISGKSNTDSFVSKTTSSTVSGMNWEIYKDGNTNRSWANNLNGTITTETLTNGYAGDYTLYVYKFSKDRGNKDVIHMEYKFSIIELDSISIDPSSVYCEVNNTHTVNPEINGIWKDAEVFTLSNDLFDITSNAKPISSVTPTDDKTNTTIIATLKANNKFTASYTVTPYALTDIELVNLDNVDKVFMIGEQFSFAGLQIKTTYSNGFAGSTFNATASMVDSNEFDSTKLGRYEIFVTYGGITKSYTVRTTLQDGANTMDVGEYEPEQVIPGNPILKTYEYAASNKSTDPVYSNKSENKATLENDEISIDFVYSTYNNYTNSYFMLGDKNAGTTASFTFSSSKYKINKITLSCGTNNNGVFADYTLSSSGLDKNITKKNSSAATKEDLVFEVNGVTDFVLSISNEKIWRFYGLKIEYEIPTSTTIPAVTHQYSNADQAKLFADYFLELTTGYCDGTLDNQLIGLDSLNILKQEYSYLTADAKKLFYGAEIQQGKGAYYETSVIEAASRYADMQKSRGYGNFLGLSEVELSKLAGSRNNPILVLNEVDSSVWVISAVALVGLTAIGGYFFYRKRKEI